MADIKAVILAGGMGTRLIEETQHRPKPMVEIGGMPILWHLMKIYSTHGINEFIVCCGYKGHMIKEFFANYFVYRSDMTFDLGANRTEWIERNAEPWRVTLIDTGEHTQTGGRLKRVARFLKDDPLFCFTYGDGVGDIDVTALIAFHKEQGTLATVTAVQPPGRFGSLSLDKSRILAFNEKPQGDNVWVSGGFFVLSPETIDRIEGDDTVWERQPLESLAREGNLAAYRHPGYWHPMDSMRDKMVLEEAWSTGHAPWKTW